MGVAFGSPDGEIVLRDMSRIRFIGRGGQRVIGLNEVGGDAPGDPVNGELRMIHNAKLFKGCCKQLGDNHSSIESVALRDVWSVFPCPQKKPLELEIGDAVGKIDFDGDLVLPVGFNDETRLVHAVRLHLLEEKLLERFIVKAGGAFHVGAGTGLGLESVGAGTGGKACYGEHAVTENGGVGVGVQDDIGAGEIGASKGMNVADTRRGTGREFKGGDMFRGPEGKKSVLSVQIGRGCKESAHVQDIAMEGNGGDGIVTDGSGRCARKGVEPYLIECALIGIRGGAETWFAHIGHGRHFHVLELALKTNGFRDIQSNVGL